MIFLQTPAHLNLGSDELTCVQVIYALIVLYCREIQKST